MSELEHALYIPPFGELADPRRVVVVTVAAEEAGWDGVFLWDHVLRPPRDPNEIANVWVALAAMAVATSRVRLGPMVTPITRRRPINVAREAVGVDQLSNGRLIVGLGLGVDSGGELTRLGEIAEPRVRGERLDEGAELLARLWSGETVHHAGMHFTIDGVALEPTPVQRPRIPMWLACRGTPGRPIRRAARYDGVCPIDIDLDDLGVVAEMVVAERGSLEGFDIVARYIDVGDDLDEAARRGATWIVHRLDPGDTMTTAMAIATSGPP